MTVSVLIPVYNAERYIGECLESVCNQTYEDLQIVIIDDGSSDATYQIMDKFASKDSRIEMFSRPNLGVAQTRNELIEKANGDYILFVDADDWLEPDMIENLLDICMDYHVDISMCSHATHLDKQPDIFAQNKSAVVSVYDQNEILYKFLEHREITGALWNKLIKSELYQSIKFQKGIAYGEDAMVTWDILLKTNEMAFTSAMYYNYRIHQNSTSSKPLSEDKMSVIPVWEHICHTVPQNDAKLQILADSRMGAECTLLLYDAAKNCMRQNNNIALLRQHVRNHLPKMIRSKVLSPKFLSFALIVSLSWKMACMVKKFNN